MVDVGDVEKVFVKSGYAASRKVFTEIEKSMQSICRRQDRLHRIGDNTFCLLFSGVQKSGQVILAAEKLGRVHSQTVDRFDPGRLGRCRQSHPQSQRRTGIGAQDRAALRRLYADDGRQDGQ